MSVSPARGHAQTNGVSSSAGEGDVEPLDDHLWLMQLLHFY